jgi:hypothetical protein
MEHFIRRGFGAKRVKEFFVIQVDGDTMAGVVAGPFESEVQCWQAIDALRPLYNRPLTCAGGHLVSWVGNWQAIGE